MAAAKRPPFTRAATPRPSTWRWPRHLSITREGKYFIGMSLGIGFAAVNTGNNLLYLLLGVMLAFIVASGLLAEMSLRGLETGRHPPARAFAGRPFLMGISLRNGKRRFPSLSIEVEDLLDDKPLDKKCYFLKIPAGRLQQTSYRHVIRRRGLYRFSGFRVSTRFPFALFRKSLSVEQPGELLVFPALRPIFAPTGSEGPRPADLSGRLGRRGEFHGLRALREGDDPRDVHWPSSARAGRLLVREREEEASHLATLRLDNGLPHDAAGEVTEEDLESLDRLVSTTASLAAEYIAEGYSVRIVARGASVPFGADTPHLLRMLRFLALLPAALEEAPFALDEGTASRGSEAGVLVVRRQSRAAIRRGEQLLPVA